MTKYVRVKELPENLSEEDYVISAPTFIEEVRRCSRRAPKNKLTTSNYMKDIAAAVGDKYMDENFNALIAVNTSRFRGLPFNNEDDVNAIVRKMFEKSVPEIFDKYVDYHIRHRPHGTKLIYFLGDHSETAAFAANGIDEISSKEVGAYKGQKMKKVVGRPAVKDEDVV